MSKYIIVCNEDNSFQIEEGVLDNKIENQVRDLTSFSLQYLYTVLNGEKEIMLSESAKQRVIDSINSFGFDKDDMRDLSRLITKIGDRMNKSMMTYDNGIPKLWEDEI